MYIIIFLKLLIILIIHQVNLLYSFSLCCLTFIIDNISPIIHLFFIHKIIYISRIQIYNFLKSLKTLIFSFLFPNVFSLILSQNYFFIMIIYLTMHFVRLNLYSVILFASSSYLYSFTLLISQITYFLLYFISQLYDHLVQIFYSIFSPSIIYL